MAPFHHIFDLFPIANTLQVFVRTISVLASPDYLPRIILQPSLSSLAPDELTNAGSPGASNTKMQPDTARYNTQTDSDGIQDFLRRYPAGGSESRILSLTKRNSLSKLRSSPRLRSAPRTRSARWKLLSSIQTGWRNDIQPDQWRPSPTRQEFSKRRT